jgi:hypothetical protein
MKVNCSYCNKSTKVEQTTGETQCRGCHQIIEYKDLKAYKITPKELK